MLGKYSLCVGPWIDDAMEVWFLILSYSSLWVGLLIDSATYVSLSYSNNWSGWPILIFMSFKCTSVINFFGLWRQESSLGVKSLLTEYAIESVTK